MKTHYLLNLKHAIPAFGLLLLFSFTGCCPDPQERTETEEGLVKDSMSFVGLNSALELRLESIAASGTLSGKSHEYMKKYFTYAYLDGANANLDMPDIQIAPATFDSYVKVSGLQTSGKSLVIHYVALPGVTDVTRRYIAYALALAPAGENGLLKNQGLPDFPNKFLLVKAANQFEVIDSNTLLLYRGYYQQLYNQSFSKNTAKRKITALPNHALSCSHGGLLFWHFYTANVVSETIKNNWKIRFDHGAIHTDIYLNERYWVHTPMMYFADAMGAAQITNGMDPYHPFKEMVFDLGHLCPPDCDK